MLLVDVCSLIWLALIGLFRSRASLQVEILTLRHQLNVLRRKSPQRLTFSSIDRLVFAGLYRLAPGEDPMKSKGLGHWLQGRFALTEVRRARREPADFVNSLK
jgi:hypothetical protein